MVVMEGVISAANCNVTADRLSHKVEGFTSREQSSSLHSITANYSYNEQKFALLGFAQTLIDLVIRSPYATHFAGRTLHRSSVKE